MTTYNPCLVHSSIPSYCGGVTYLTGISASGRYIEYNERPGLHIFPESVLPLFQQDKDASKLNFYDFTGGFVAGIRTVEGVNDDDSTIFDDFAKYEELMEEALDTVIKFSFNKNSSNKHHPTTLSAFYKGEEDYYPNNRRLFDNATQVGSYVLYGSSPMSVAERMGDRRHTLEENAPDKVTVSTVFLYLLYKHSTLFSVKKEAPWLVRPGTDMQPVYKIPLNVIREKINPLLHDRCKVPESGNHNWYISALPPLFNQTHNYRSFGAVIQTDFGVPIIVKRN